MEDFIIEYEKKTLRKLEWFDKVTHHIVGQEELKGINLIQLREIYNITVPFDIEFDEASDEWPDPYMVNVCDVDLDKAPLLQPFITHKINLEMYIYELGCYAKVERVFKKKKPMEDFVEEFEMAHLRYLIWLDKNTGYQIDKEEMTDVTMMDLRPIFKVEDSFYKKDGSLYTWGEACEDEDNEDFDPYMKKERSINKNIQVIFQALVSHKIDLDAYEYIIGCYAIR